MKTKYEYIHFNHHEGYQSYKWWTCHNNRMNDELGEVEYNKQWRRWEFTADVHAAFSASCLDDISHFMKQLKDAKEIEKVK